MKYHALFVIFEKAVNLKLFPAANYRWRFRVNDKHTCTHNFNLLINKQVNLIDYANILS